VTFPDRSLTPVGAGGYYYDAAISRWLPVQRWAISPDGRRYAYTEGWSVNPPKAPRVHVVDAVAATDLLVATMPDARPFAVIDFTNAGVYLGIRYEGSGPGVWLLDVVSGKVTKVSDGYYAPNASWVSVIDSRDPNPYKSPFSGEVAPNRIDHREAGGQTSPWFYHPGHALHWVQFADVDSLFVQASWNVPNDPQTGAVEYWLVTAANQATLIAAYTSREASPYDDLWDGFLRAIADSHGIWIGGEQSLHLVTRTGVIQRVYPQSAYPANGCI
jgi:hypothetical protein